MGDYNIDLAHSIQLSNTNTTHNNKFLNILSLYAFYPCINKPTRITSVSATLIDNIFTNTLDKETSSGVFSYDVSDHLPIFMISSQLKFKNGNEHKNNMYRKENPENIMALNEDLINEEWLDIYGENDANKAYEKFINKLTYYYDKNIPLIQLKQRRNHIKNPWITRGILHSIQIRNKLYKSYIRKPSEQSHNFYLKYRNRLTDIIRTSKKMYYSQELKKAEGNINSTWKVINKLINKNKLLNKIDTLNVDSQEITDPSDIAQALNSFFTNI